MNNILVFQLVNGINTLIVSFESEQDLLDWCNENHKNLLDFTVYGKLEHFDSYGCAYCGS